MRHALGAILLLLAPVLSLAQSVVRGPYLQTPTPTSVIVKWRTDIATDSVVGYAVVDGLPSSTSSIASTTEHEVVLNGLSPDTLYNYTIGSSSLVIAGGDLNTNGDGEHFFTMPPSVGTDKETRVWVIGDSGTANANAAAVRDAYKSFTGTRDTDLWLMLGDNAYETGTDIEYQAAVFEMYPQLLRQAPLWSTLGNHELSDMSSNPPGAYPQIFSFPTVGESGGIGSGTENYYSFDYGNIHFISLDSTIANRAGDSIMWTWLEADLIANTQDWTIVFWHDPPYTDYGIAALRIYALPLLELYGVDLVLSGHKHTYARSFLLNGHYGEPESLSPAMVLDGGDGNEYGDGVYVKPGPAGTAHEGTIYVVVGTSGGITGSNLPLGPAMYAHMNIAGSMVLDVSGNRLDAAFIDSTGVALDEFTIIKSPPQVVEIDVDPFSEDNEILPNSDNSILVAIFGSSIADGDWVDFDVTDIDPASLKFGPAEAPTPWWPWAITDFDGDGHSDDAGYGFSTAASGIGCSEELDNSAEVTLTGMADGQPFIGTDTVYTSDCTTGVCHPPEDPYNDPSESCGEPVFDKNSELGTFLWEDCDGSGMWHLRVTGGGLPTGTSYDGVIESAGGLISLTGYSIESSDILDTVSNPDELAYVLNTYNAGIDGFDFVPAVDACFIPGGPGLPVYLGDSRIELLTVDLELDDLGACTESQCHP